LVIINHVFLLLFISILRLKVYFMMQYLPIEGLAAFNKATADLLLGADNPVIKQGRVWLFSTCQRSCYIGTVWHPDTDVQW
jgi:hypothetical protein